MKSWYKRFVELLWYYYKIKQFIIFNLKIIFVIKLYSIYLDMYNGYFPKVFQDIMFKKYWIIYSEIFNLNFLLYWKNVFWLLVVFIFLFVFFYTRLSFLDWIEVKKRQIEKLEKEKKLNEEKLKNMAKENKLTVKDIHILDFKIKLQNRKKFKKVKKINV